MKTERIERVDFYSDGLPVGRLPGPTLAVLHMSDGTAQELTWAGLEPYWAYATPEDIEGGYYDACDDQFLGWFSVACGQGGILALWDCARRRWAFVAEASYVICEMLVRGLGAVLSLHYVSNSATPARHEVGVYPLSEVLDGFRAARMPLRAEHQATGFRPSEHPITRQVMPPQNPCELGPTGIFWAGPSDTFYVHDAGHLYTVTRSQIVDALTAALKGSAL